MTEVSRDQATLDSYDGVELRFLNGVVRKCKPFTVAEAAHYFRLEARIRDGELAAAPAFAAEFVERVGMLDVRLADIGLEVEGHVLEFGGLSVADGIALADIVADAQGADLRKAPRAQVRILDEVPAMFGLAVPQMRPLVRRGWWARVLRRRPRIVATRPVGGPEPGEVFEIARAFTEALYLHIYGLAKDFCGHLSRSPRAKVMTLTRGTAAPAESSSLTPASMI